jgi:hypothetical protein
LSGALAVVLGLATTQRLWLVAAGVLLSGGLTVAACWLLSRPERRVLRVEGAATTWRQWLWTAGVTAVVLDVAMAVALGLVLTHRDGPADASLGQAILLLGATLTIPVAPVLIVAVDVLVMLAMLNMLRLLARRVPDDWLTARATRYRWLLPVVALAGLPAAWLWTQFGGGSLSGTLREVDPGAVLVLFSGLVLAGVMYLNVLDRFRRDVGAVLRQAEPHQDDGMLA